MQESNVIPFDQVVSSGKMRNLIKRHLELFNAAANAYLAELSGVGCMPSMVLEDPMHTAVGTKGVISESIRQVMELVLSERIHLHRPVPPIDDPIPDNELWERVIHATGMYLQICDVCKTDQVSITFSYKKVERFMITKEPMYKVTWRLCFLNHETEFTFSILGYIKALQRVNLGITFVTNEGE